jgi:4-carboxymuconolactone decarboxylase
MKKQKALDFARALDSTSYEGLSELRVMCPDLVDAHIEHLYGEVYQRDGLTLRERLLVSVAMLMMSSNLQPQLMNQAKIALKNNITREDLLEVAFQMSAFAGFPSAINAVSLLDVVAQEYDVERMAEMQVAVDGAPGTATEAENVSKVN